LADYCRQYANPGQRESVQIQPVQKTKPPRFPIHSSAGRPFQFMVHLPLSATVGKELFQQGSRVRFGLDAASAQWEFFQHLSPICFALAPVEILQIKPLST
jgi:hypothetical protein